MTGPTPYLLLPGTAHAALTFYQGVFGGEIAIATYAEAGRDDGPRDAVAHGTLTGPVELFAADAAPGEEPVNIRGAMFALLGTADAGTLEAWFSALAEGGRVVDPLQARPWGDHDGQVADRFGVTWLIGYAG